MKFVSIMMIQTATGSPDGLSVRTFEKGKQYEVPELLANVFINELQIATDVTVARESTKPRKKRVTNGELNGPT